MSTTLTALQPTGLLHLGNYFGAIEPMVEQQDSSKINLLFIVDYHAITIPQDPDALRKSILFATATYLAAGIDPDKTLLFQQSRVPQHTELAWVLNCHAYMGELERMTQFKDKSQGKGKSVSIGLFDYPVLMAADILLYGTKTVPVGDDQKQHLELARDLAERFNNKYGETFVIPEPKIRTSGARLMGLNDPEQKMSKSAPSPKNYISLMDDEATVLKKIKSAVTDSQSTIKFEPERKGLANLLTIYSLVSKRPIDDIVQEHEGKGYGDFKKNLAAAITEFLTPLQKKIQAHLENEDELKRILNEGAQKAQAVAEIKMKEVRKKIGLTL